MESSIDWKIHRKLDGARTVYLTVARGNGKTLRTHELYENLTGAGKKVADARVDTCQKIRKMPTLQDVEKAIDILGPPKEMWNPWEPFWHMEYLGEWIYKEPEKTEGRVHLETYNPYFERRKLDESL